MQRVRTPQLAEESPMPSLSLTPQEFVAKWRGDTRKEHSVAQEHFIDLCCMIPLRAHQPYGMDDR
jgi:hypothetical protein